jgi:hypothetical protein
MSNLQNDSPIGRLLEELSLGWQCQEVPAGWPRDGECARHRGLRPTSTVQVDDGRVRRSNSYKSRRQAVVEAVNTSRSALLQWEENGGSLAQDEDQEVRKWPDDLEVIDDDLVTST